MKRKSLIISIVLISIIIVFGVVFAVIKLTNNDGQDNDNNNTLTVKNYEVLELNTKEDISTLADKKKYEAIFEENECYIYSIDIFEKKADFDCTLSGNSIDRLSVYIPLYQIPYPIEEDTETDDEYEMEYIPHEYSEEELYNAEECFNSIKAYFEQYLNCGNLTRFNYVTTNPTDEITGEFTDEELFYKGYKFKEFSVKDKDGTLWLLRFNASEYDGTATIVKIINTTGFEGYIPIIDMTEGN